MAEAREIRHFHLFCGLGGGAQGFNDGHARVGTLEARFRCLGGVDSDAAAVRDFERLTGVRGTVLDLFSREQYAAFHGHEPPAGWHEATPEDVRRAARGERPHIVFTSPPCKGFSGLLSQKRSLSARYQALNGLTVRGIWLALEAWTDDPPEFFILENVPRVATRGRHLIDEITALMRAYGYAVAETTHDCGELGGLAQSRKRFLLVARHQEKVPPFLYEPERRPLQAVGTVLGRMPMPEEPQAGPMHRLPRLQWRTWVRLAFVEAGSDWRSLDRLRVRDGVLEEFALVREGRQDASAVADPSWRGREYGQYGVRRLDEPSGAVSGQSAPGGGRYSVADPRLDGAGRRYNNVYRVVRWDEVSPAITGGTGPTAGGMAVSDPRTGLDPRKPAFLTAGHYGVIRWDGKTGAVTAAASHDNGAWSVADPRLMDGPERRGLPEATERLLAVIRAIDGTWHRPFTTLELAALQGLVDPEEHLELGGLSDSAWRERIGNAVPPPAASAIASVMGQTLLLAWSGETFVLSAQPVWVRPIALAATMP